MEVLGWDPFKSAQQVTAWAQETIRDPGKALANAGGAVVGTGGALLQGGRKALDELGRVPERAKELLSPASQPPVVPRKITRRDVFVIHGHDDGALDEVKNALTAWGLIPRVLKEEAGQLRTIKQKFEKVARSKKLGFAIALFTPDDECRGGSQGLVKRRVRQNVLLELGFFMSVFKSRNTCILCKGEVEWPSDLAGVIPIDMGQPRWKGQLYRELKSASMKMKAPPPES